MAGIIKVNQYQDFNGNTLFTSDGNGNLTTMKTNYPAFHVSINTEQTGRNTTQTVVQYNVVSFDTNNCYSTSTYRFTPNVAGKYFFGMTIRYDNVNSSRCIGYIYKNSNIYNLDEMWSDSGSGPDLSPKVYATMEMNGSTDYVECKTYHDKGFAVNTNPVNEAINFFGFRIGS